MDDVRDEHERAAGQTFIDWYNRNHRTAFKLVGRSPETPDLVFRDGDREVRAEIATASYDFIESKIRWMHAPNDPDAQRIGSGFDFQAELTRSINQQIAHRCSEDRGAARILLIYIPPTVTTATMMREVLEKLAPPERNPFEGIYLAGNLAKLKRIGKAEICIKQLA